MFGYHFDVYQDTVAYWRWRLVAPNGQTIASSGEAFYSRSNAVQAAANIKAHAGNARVA